MDCPTCLGANPASARTCEHCGASLVATCAHCGTHLAPGARFCSSCGRPAADGDDPGLARLPGVGDDGERRPVTVLFADIVGSTALAQRLDPEDYRAILERAIDGIEVAVRRHDGTVAQLLGDGVLAFFGAPIAHDDDPLRAAFAAREIVDLAATFAAELATTGIEFAVRVGIDTGLVVVGPIGGDSRREYLALGEVVNVAARLQSIAPPMQIYVSQAVAARVEPCFRLREIGSVVLRGRTGMLRVWALGPEEVPSRRASEARAGPIVGRVPELTTLRAALAALWSGTGRLVVILGEPGIGKSRLVQACRAMLESTDRSAGVTTGPGDPAWVEVGAMAHGDRAGYQIVASLARAMLVPGTTGVRPDRPTLEGAMPAAGPTVTGAIARLVGLPLSQLERADLELLGPSHWPSVYVRAVSELVAGRADRGPTVVAIEDVQWADPSSVDVLARVLEVVRDHPVLFILVSRPDTATAGWRLVTAAREVAGPDLIELALGPLGQAEADELAARFLGPRSTYLPLVRERSEGNPLFIEELARSLAEIRPSTGPPVEPSAMIPAALQGLILARLDRLPSEARSTARLAAVIGRRFPLPLLEEVARSNGIRSDLDGLQRAGLVEVVPSASPEEFAFRHALVQEAAYGSLLHADARRLHGTVGRVLAARAGEEPSLAPTVARHFAAAGLHRDAVEWFRVGIDVSRAGFANEEALALLDDALASAATLRASEGARVDRTIADLQRDRGDVLALIGRASEARSAYEAALRALPADEVIERSRVLRSIGPTFEQDQRYADAEAAFAAAESVLGEPRADDPAWWPAWLDVRLRCCELLYWAGRIGELETAINQLEAPVRVHGDCRQRGDFHSRVVMMLGLRDRYRPDETAIEHQRAALREMEALGSASSIAYMQFALGWVEMWGGHLDDAEKDLLASQALAEKIGDTAMVGRGDAYLAVLYRLQHRPDQALDVGQRAIEICAALGRQFQPYAAVGHAVLGAALITNGDLEAARWRLEHAVEILEDYAKLRWVPFPFEWIARLPLLAVEVRERHFDGALGTARHLLDASQQVLPRPISGPLEAAVGHAGHRGRRSAIWTELRAAVAAAEGDGRI